MQGQPNIQDCIAEKPRPCCPGPPTGQSGPTSVCWSALWVCTSCHELAAFLPCVDMLTIICCQMLRHHISLSSTPQKTPVVPACKAYVTHSRPRCCYRKAESQWSAVNERMNVSQPECYHRRCMIDTHCCLTKHRE